MSTDTGCDPRGATPPLPHLLPAPSVAEAPVAQQPSRGWGRRWSRHSLPGHESGGSREPRGTGQGGPGCGGLPCRQALPTQSTQHPAQPSIVGPGGGINCH